jgi:thiamine transport system permease protein
LFLLLFFFIPLTRILRLGAGFEGLEQDAIRRAVTVVRFTFYQAALSTLLTLALGPPAAVLFARFAFRGKALLKALTGVPFLLPTVVVASAFHSLLGPGGWMNQLFPAISIQFIGTLSAIVTAHVFYNTTIVIRLVGSALARLDPKLEQAARSLGADPRRVWWKVTLPLLKPSLLAAVLLVFLFDFSSFGVILLLGGSKFSTLEVEIYLRIVKRPDLTLAALLAVIQLACTLAVSIVYTRLAARGTVQTAPGFDAARRPKSRRERAFVGFMVSLLTIFFLLPQASLPLRSFIRLDAERGRRPEAEYGFTTDYYRELFINRRGSLFYVPPIGAAWNSIRFAAATALLSLALGFPAATALARPTSLEKVLDPLIMLPLGASAVMLGLGFILTFGRALALPMFIPLAHTLVALPFVIRALQPAIASIPDGLRHAAATLGASPIQVWRRVDLPILRRSVVSAIAFAFTVSLGEFGASLLLSRPEYPTIPVAISRFLSLAGGLNFGQAMAMSTILMAITVLCFLVIEREAG